MRATVFLAIALSTAQIASASGQKILAADESFILNSIDKLRKKWESCRGIGYSFGYNAAETDEHMLSEDDLIDLLVDIVSKNGNLLLNVGPKADGSVSDLQSRRLKALGQWLKTNGEVIYKTRPWKTAEGKTTDDIEVRFTQKPNALYAILLQKPAGNNVTVKSLIAAPKTKIRLLGSKQNITWQQHETDLLIHLPENLPAQYAYALKITPAPINAHQNDH